MKIKKFKIQIFLDGAKIEDIKRYSNTEYISGFTTNPSLLRKAGVVDYVSFVKKALPLSGGKPVSLEVISDDFGEMKRQAIELNKFGRNVYVKIPVTNTKGVSSGPLIRELALEKIKVNITAVMTAAQISKLSGFISRDSPSIVSIFAGRIADCGVNPVSIIKQAQKALRGLPNTKLLWASSREIFNIRQAEDSGCDIITVTPELLSKIHLLGYDLERFSLDTVKMFYYDALLSKLTI